MSRHEWIYATPRQEELLRKLWREVANYGTAEWEQVRARRLLKSEASTTIQMLLRAIAKGKEQRNKKDE